MENKKRLYYLIGITLIIITMVIGGTFTYFILASQEKEDGTIIKTGTLEINYIDGKSINANNLMPINEPNLNTEDNVYKKNFTVKSTGSLDQNIDIYLDINANEFSDNIIGFAIYDDNNNKLNSGTIPKSGRILLKSNLYLKSNTSNNYVVLIWLKENNNNQDNEINKTLKGDFYITANQITH